MLKSGIPWQMLPTELGYGSGSTCWRRFRTWTQLGVWPELHRRLVRVLGRGCGAGWRPCGDRQRLNAGAQRGAHTGPNPTDRGKNGCKRHVVTDADGLPLATIHLDRATPRHHNWVATLGWTFTRGPEGQPTSWISAP